MTVKAIFWDNDGVLVDTEALYFRACAETLAGCGVELSRERFIDISLNRGESVLRLARHADQSAIRRIRNDRYAALLATGNLVLPGVEEVLRKLHGRVAMGIVTSSLRSHFEVIHQRSGLLPYFDFVLTREDYGRSKPHPEPYLTALERSGLEPHQCLVVEDSPRGIRAAVDAGLRCCAIPGQLTAAGDLSLAGHILGDIGELPAIVFAGDSPGKNTS